MLSKFTIINPSVRRHSWFERPIAILAVINYALVLFNLSYIPLRDFYLKFFPGLTQIYDPVKGIEPHPETQNYLKKVNELEEQISESGLQSARTKKLLKDLQILSNRLIEDNPFAGANKSSTLEKIKNEMRHRVRQDFARDAFATFWSQAYLAQAGWRQEIYFFNTRIQPLIITNYYRDIGGYGRFTDYFWLIDLPFVVVFALEILARTYYISRRKPHLSWWEAIVRRWYDFFLLLPFWRWLRVIPVTIRLYQADLLNLDPLLKQLNYDLAVSFADKLAEIVGIQVINRMQESIQRGDVANWLFHPESHHPYVQMKNRNGAKAIATRLVNIGVYDIIPKIQPDVEALVHHSIEITLNKCFVYRQLRNVPGLNRLPTKLTEKLAKNLSQTAYESIITVFEDPAGAELTARLLRNFRDALEVELKKKQNLQEVQSLLIDILDEIKIDYVRGIAEGGIEKALDEVEKLHRNLYQS